MTYEEKLMTPHAVYRFRDAAGTLLYVGCSRSFFGRFKTHLYNERAQEVASVTVSWYPGFYEAAKEEARAIAEEGPIWNQSATPPERIGTDRARRAAAKPRGDGIHCPRCGAPKKRRHATYCRPCQKEYQEEWWRAKGVIPKRERPPTPCPKCGGPKDQG